MLASRPSTRVGNPGEEFPDPALAMPGWLKDRASRPLHASPAAFGQAGSTSIMQLIICLPGFLRIFSHDHMEIHLLTHSADWFDAASHLKSSR